MNENVVAGLTPESSRIVFTNERRKFRWLAIRGVLLEVVTAAIYRFWLATELRRHLWSRTALNDDAVEYTGTGKELLLGFLSAMAILVPFNILYFLVALQLERWKGFAIIPLVLVLYLFAQFVVYRARRYRLTRTVWRGVRFWMTGSGLIYALQATLWSFLTLVTLGLALPWREASLERYKMRHTSYGDLAGRFEGTGWGLFKRGWWLWLLVVLAVVGIGLGIAIPLSEKIDAIVAAIKEGANMRAANGPQGNLDMNPTPAKAQLISALFAVRGEFLILIGYPFVHAIYEAIKWRWWASGIRLGEVSVSSDLKHGAFIGLYWKVVGWTILIGIGVAFMAIISGFIAAAVTGGLSGQDIRAASAHPAALVAVIASCVVWVLAFSVVARVYLMHDIWQRMVESVTVHNLAAANNVSVKGKLASALGAL